MEARQRHITKDRVCGPGLIQRIAIDPELNAARTRTEERLKDNGQGRLATVHSGVEEADGWGDLPAKDCTHQHPAQVALVVGSIEILC